MADKESLAAWRFFELNWLPIAGMCAVLAFCLAVTDFSIGLAGAGTVFSIAAIYTGFAYRSANATKPGRPTVVFMLGSIAQGVLITSVMAPLTYIAAAAAFPLQDANLFAIDQALGLDWRGYLAFVDEHPLMSALLAKAYALIGSQILLVPLLLAAVGRFCRLQQYILALALTLIATTAISIFVPAIGVYYQLGLTAADHPNVVPGAYLDCSRDLPLVRDGVLRHLDLFKLAGIVTFPSFHAASAVLYAWALWPIRWARPVVVIINGAMLASTPVGGGHYFIDLFAGIAVTVLAIVAARWVRRTIDAQVRAAPEDVAAEVPGATAAAGNALSQTATGSR
jgi:PAP2 superfamily protein